MLINGQKSVDISAFDRGLQYGDGLFETIAVFASEPLLWQKHMQRLVSGCERLFLPIPDVDLLWQQGLDEIGQDASGVLKIIITRGNGGRGYVSPQVIDSNCLVSFTPMSLASSSDWVEGIAVKLCDTVLSINPVLAGIKHLNRLEQVMARHEWQSTDIKEGLMKDLLGRWLEGVSSNLFVVRGQKLMTANINQLAVAGVMREFVIEQWKEMGFKISFSTFSLEELLDADAIFVTNSIIGLLPIKYIDGNCIEMRLPKELMRRVQAVSLMPKEVIVS